MEQAEPEGEVVGKSRVSLLTLPLLSTCLWGVRARKARMRLEDSMVAVLPVGIVAMRGPEVEQAISGLGLRFKIGLLSPEAEVVPEAMPVLRVVPEAA